MLNDMYVQAIARIHQSVRLKMNVALRSEPVAALVHHNGALKAAHDPHRPHVHQEAAQRKLHHGASTVFAADVEFALKIDLQVGWLSSWQLGLVVDWKMPELHVLSESVQELP